MSYLKSLTYLSFFSAMLLFSCSEENSSAPLPLFLNDVSPKEVYFSQQVRLFGQGFGSPADSSYVQYDSLRIDSENCIQWTSSSIKFEAPEIKGEINIKVVVNGEESNSKKINAGLYPPLQLEEVPPGKFQIGSQSGFANEKPSREIIISGGFYISKYEISQLHFTILTGGNPEDVENAEVPVSGVTWREAVLFCNKLSQAEGYEPVYEFHGEDVYWMTDLNGYRLPTEAEWEYACRAGSAGSYAGSGNLNDMGWYIGNSGLNIHPSGRKEANDWNIFDMHGNLWEWCWDFYGGTYYKVIPGKDPIGPDSGERHVIRGGDCKSGEVYCRSANRSIPGREALENAGIRVVRNK